jgi:hypothetical protein
VTSQIEKFNKTFSDTPRDKLQGQEIINNIIRQLNNHSLRGYINNGEFRDLVVNSTKELFYLIFLQQFEFPEDYTKRMEDEAIAKFTDAGSTNPDQIKEYMEKRSKDYNEEGEIIHAKIINKSSWNLMYLLMTRVAEGRDYKLIEAEINSKKPILLTQAR